MNDNHRALFLLRRYPVDTRSTPPQLPHPGEFAALFERRYLYLGGDEAGWQLDLYHSRDPTGLKWDTGNKWTRLSGHFFGMEKRKFVVYNQDRSALLEKVVTRFEGHGNSPVLVEYTTSLSKSRTRWLAQSFGRTSKEQRQHLRQSAAEDADAGDDFVYRLETTPTTQKRTQRLDEEEQTAPSCGGASISNKSVDSDGGGNGGCASRSAAAVAFRGIQQQQQLHQERLGGRLYELVLAVDQVRACARDSPADTDDECTSDLDGAGGGPSLSDSDDWFDSCAAVQRLVSSPVSSPSSSPDVTAHRGKIRRVCYE